MNQTEARLIMCLNQLDQTNRNIHFLSAKLDKSFSAVYNYLKILEANNLISKVKSANNKTYYSTNEIALKQAREVLTNVSK